MAKVYRIQLLLLCIVGMGALAGGIMTILDPYGALYGMSTDLLEKGPFNNFLIPGLFLFFVIGMGHLIAFVFVKWKIKFYAYISGGMGGILVAWILIQCYVLQSIHSLHIIFFVVGLLEGTIALFMIVKKWNNLNGRRNNVCK